MEEDDVHTFSPQTQELLRRHAVRQMTKGESFLGIAELLGVPRNTVSDGWRRHEAKGAKALKSRHRGAVMERNAR